MKLVSCSLPIFEQLELEEALLRAGEGDWCILNQKSPPAIVLGLSSDLEALIDLERVKKNPLPLIRRFSGGGAVVVDEDTLFFTLILDKKTNPLELMRWTGEILAPVFLPYTLVVEENDYVLEGKKIGGNAQSFARGRVLHHTSFLWSWKKEHMSYLCHPKNQPVYRENRLHDAFCGRLSSCFSSKEAFFEKIKEQLSRYFLVEPISFYDAKNTLPLSFLKRLQRVEPL